MSRADRRKMIAQVSRSSGRQVIPIPGYGQWRTEQIRRAAKRKPKSQLGPWPDFGNPFYNSRNQRN